VNLSSSMGSSETTSSTETSKRFKRFDSTIALVNEVSGQGRMSWKDGLQVDKSKRNLQVLPPAMGQLLRIGLNCHTDGKMWIKRLWGGLLKSTSRTKDLLYIIENVYESGKKARESYEQVLKTSPNNILVLNCYASLLRDIFRYDLIFCSRLRVLFFFQR
jgi:hypothetical protein